MKRDPQPLMVAGTAGGTDTPAGMDRPLVRRRHGRWLGAVAVLLAVAAAVVLARLAQESAATPTIALDEVTIAQAQPGRFEDTIPVRAAVTPLQTVYLDAMEGGQVERVLVEDGAIVRAGQLIAEMSNPALQLDVIAREAQVTEQLNALRGQELALERSRLDNAARLAELRFRQLTVGDNLAQQQALAAQGFVSSTSVQRTEHEHRHLRELMQVADDNQRATERLQTAQLTQLREASSRLAANLALARGNLASLQVRATVDGQLTAFALRRGQRIERGARIGQIDSPADFKLSAAADQFYLSRVAIDQAAHMDSSDGQRHELRVSRIYPQVAGGEFRFDLRFTGRAPTGLTRGQTLNVTLRLGEGRDGLLLPVGAFLQSGGSAFVFVADLDRRGAQRRAVQLGRRNHHHVEVLDGLAPGESVITSSYASFSDRQRVRLVGP